MKLLERIKLLNPEGKLDRSSAFFYILTGIAVFVSVATKSVSAEVLGLLTLAAGYTQVDKLQTIRAGDTAEEKAALVAKVEAAAADAAGAKAQAAQTAFEAVQLKDKLTQVDNRTKGRG